MGFPFTWNGAPLLSLGLTTTLWFRPHDGLTANVLRALDAYMVLTGDRMKWCAGDPKSLRWKRYGPSTLDRIREYVSAADDDSEWEFDIESGEQFENVTPFRVSAYGGYTRRPVNERFGFFQFYLPLSFWAGRSDTAEALFQSVCEAIRPTYGYTAIGFLTSSDLSRRRRVEWIEGQLAIRNPALMVEDPRLEAQNSGYEDEPRNFYDGIKSGSWLTVLGEHWAGQMGGAGRLAAALGADFTVRPYPGGLTIQAGAVLFKDGFASTDPVPASFFAPPHIDIAELEPFPLADDLVTLPPSDFPLLQRLNRVLGPILNRNVNLNVHLDQAGTGLTLASLEASSRWLARFD